MLMTTPKDLWIQNVIESLKEFASSEFQEKGWIKGEIYDYCCYTEIICGLFHESIFDDFVDEKAKEFGFSSDQIEKLDRFRKAVRVFDARYGGWEDPQIILNDPEWSRIRELAKDALKSLGIEHYLDPSKDIFKKSLLRLIYWIADPEIFKQKSLQERPNTEKNPFEEFMDDIFRSSKFEEIIAQYKEYEITESQLILLKSIRDKLKLYKEKTPKPHNLIEVLEDPEWHQIQILATEVVNAFGFIP